ncbi:phage portal protein [Bacillus subtilis]|uniref:phage portal protein n=1 Tax=Bacillus subtilis TaxID=1423 RepID=UPI00240D16C6|nr:portal protein [Bacillus subtilis]WEZ19125.1 portal protein [Bacillus subtilis]
MGVLDWFKHRGHDPDEGLHVKTYGIIREGAQFPPADSIERLAKYKRAKKFFDGKQRDLYERATHLLKGTPHADQLEKLYIAINLADILVTKPADLLVGEPVRFETGKPDTSEEQKALNKYVEENDVNQLIHESTVANGYRGDAWFKVRYGYRQDFSEVKKLGLIDGDAPPGVEMEPIIEHVNANFVFPETSDGNVKTLKALNIAQVQWVETETTEIPYLLVERHIPGYIFYSKYRLYENGYDNSTGTPIQVFRIGELLPDGVETKYEETGLTHIPVFHAPYKSVDDSLFGIGLIEKLETVLSAINDRLVQIDYILYKHSDPVAFGPDLEGEGDSIQFGGRYIPVTKEDATPGYMTWNGQLDAAFKELDILFSNVFQMAETPQWLFGTTVSGESGAGTGTSHTDGAAIEARFMPILSKVKRIRTHYDKAIRDALWTCMLFDKQLGDLKVSEAVYPKAVWSDGLPKSAKELAEIMQIRTGGKPTIDVRTAIKMQDDVDDEKADETIRRIEDDEKSASGFVDSSIFNGEAGEPGIAKDEQTEDHDKAKDPEEVPKVDDE